MAISETVQKNHHELFPGHVSTLKLTDPELIEIFDNFAFDETLRQSRLDTRTRLMVQLAALISCQALSEYRVMLGAALTAGVTPAEAKEILYQAVPWRMRPPGQGARGGQPPRRQRPADADQRHHGPASVHRLPAHAQRPRRHQRDRARIQRRTLT
jgi:alkylhydroperoxidase/carboxymuconolactone decarboxylase family protein YurZ